MINYHNRKFTPTNNTENGETNSETIFHYQQIDHILTAHYQGGQIKTGQILGIVHQDGSITMKYHHINLQDEIMTGQCHSTPEILPNGKIKLYEDWQWTSGDQTKGTSTLEEI